MWFKNLTAYRLTGLTTTAQALEEALSRHPLQEIGSQESATRGWVPVYPNGPLVLAICGHYLVALGITTRNLPGSTINEAAAKKAADIEAQQGFKPGRKQMKEIKEAVIRELLPKAFTRTIKLHAWIDPTGGILAIGTASLAHAELMLDALRGDLESLPVALLKTQLAPVALMTSWLSAGEGSTGFTIDQDCELRAVTNDKAAVRYARKALDGQDVKDHLAAGMLPTRLALTFDDRVSFILTEKLQLKRLAYLGAVKEEAARQIEYGVTQAEADMAIMTGELERLIPALINALGGLVTEDAK